VAVTDWQEKTQDVCGSKSEDWESKQKSGGQSLEQRRGGGNTKAANFAVQAMRGPDFTAARRKDPSTPEI